MTREFVVNKVMTNEDIREMVGEAICKGIEFTIGDFTQIDGKTVGIAEHAIQMNYLRNNGFKEMR